MPMPKSVIKIKKDGVEYISSVDRCKYTLSELTRAALKDVAKFLRKRIIQKVKTLTGMKRTKRPYSSTQYWVRKKETDLLIGFKHDAWYGVHQEMGTRNQPRKGFLRDTVFENIDEIRRIEAQYLSAIEDEIKAKELIDEAEDREQGVTDGDE
jgi:HK97 gp10 family phage protein